MKIKKLSTNIYTSIFILISDLLVLTGCGTLPDPNEIQQVTTEPRTTQIESIGLAAYLKIQQSVQQGSGEPIIVYFLLENHTQGGLYLLKWYTPLEGIAGDIFEVTRDGQPIPYLGPLVSRAAPTSESYIFVAPDKGVTAEVNIAEAYDFSQLGTYTIKFRSPRISHLARTEAEMATSLDELGPVNIPSNEVTIDVVASSTGIGQPVRRIPEEAGEMISAHQKYRKASFRGSDRDL